MALLARKNRPQMFDGERPREIWTKADGAGDGDVDLVASGHTRVGGHPTWKLFASDFENGVQPTGHQPPVRVYLDDKSCYEVLTSGAFSANQLGKCWPYDFTQVGKLRASRPNRGRPAHLEDGRIATDYRANKVYYFYGETGKPGSKRKVADVEADERGQDEGRASVGSASQGPMETVCIDGENNTCGQEAVKNSEHDLDQPDANADADMIIAAAVTKRRRLDNDLLHKPFEELDKAGLEELRKEYIKAVEEAEEAQLQAVERRYDATRARLEQDAIVKERDQLRKDLDDTVRRLNEEHGKWRELDLVSKRNNQENLVTKSMLDKTKKELHVLKNELAVVKVRAEAQTEEAVSKLSQEYDAALELCRTLYIGHTSSKAIIEDIRQESLEDLPDSVKPFEDMQQVIYDGLESIKSDLEERGMGRVLDAVMKNNHLMDGGNTTPDGSES